MRIDRARASHRSQLEHAKKERRPSAGRAEPLGDARKGQPLEPQAVRLVDLPADALGALIEAVDVGTAAGVEAVDLAARPKGATPTSASAPRVFRKGAAPAREGIPRGTAGRSTAPGAAAFW